MHSNRYTVLYALGVTMAVAVSLAIAATSLAPRQDANAARARRIAILETVMSVDPDRVGEDYRTYITEHVYDFSGNELGDVTAFDLDLAREARKTPADRMFPVYEFEREGRTNFILPLQGAGLWGPIRAYLALESDLNTISGISFDHEKETPGLGAEITTTEFEDRFTGKRIFDERGSLAPVVVVKPPLADDDPHAVDGLTGATMTMNGVTDMFREELTLYQGIFQELSL